VALGVVDVAMPYLTLEGFEEINLVAVALVGGYVLNPAAITI
jgi:hypothetical protein